MPRWIVLVVIVVLLLGVVGSVWVSLPSAGDPDECAVACANLLDITRAESRRSLDQVEISQRDERVDLQAELDQLENSSFGTKLLEISEQMCIDQCVYGDLDADCMAKASGMQQAMACANGSGW